MGISGDRTENVLWRAQNLLIKTLKHVIIHCGTNNLNRDSPGDIADAIISIALTIKNKHPLVNVTIAGLLLRDPNLTSTLRYNISKTNYHLEISCNKYNFAFINKESEWLVDKGKLDNNLFYVDHLHFS